jgi:signal transduction histidine kinase
METWSDELSAHLDSVIATGIGAFFLVEIWSEGGFAGDRFLASATALVLSATLIFRRRAPLLPLLASVATVEISNLAVPALANTPSFLLALTVSIYACARYLRVQILPLAAVIVLAAIPLAAIEPGEPVILADFGYIAILGIAPFVAGLVIRHRQERERDLTQQTIALALERDTKARMAVAEERVRIARELHDVVAHAISVMVLQARGGRRMLDNEPEETRRALDAIEYAGEQALTEMRRLLGMLRQDEAELGFMPQPSLTRIDDLAAQLTSTGLPVDVTIEGTAVELPSGIDVSAYRIVQEALTNALKHAGPARATVIIRYGAGDLELEILDDGQGLGNGGGSGRGLIGIRERVGIFGGELESGARSEGGYAVRVRLPLGVLQ